MFAMLLGHAEAEVPNHLQVIGPCENLIEALELSCIKNKSKNMCIHFLRFHRLAKADLWNPQRSVGLSYHFLIWRQEKNKEITFFEAIIGGISMATNRIWVMAEGMERKMFYKENVYTWKHFLFEAGPCNIFVPLYMRISLSSFNKRGKTQTKYDCQTIAVADSKWVHGRGYYIIISSFVMFDNFHEKKLNDFYSQIDISNQPYDIS